MSQSPSAGARRLVVVDPATVLSVVAITCVAAVLAGHAAVQAVRPALAETPGRSSLTMQAVAFACYLGAALAAFAVAEIGLRIGTGAARALERWFVAPAATPVATRSHRRAPRRVVLRARTSAELVQG
ncbi:hypothetical protein [Solicola sp. PLA-1-18]|uniref:hypothetical protein n=1 Tax=Solicola sp. PLA-1-18 TaxID=3380532 RepID=UPI003B809F32